jgi:hypothetical protein
MPNLMVAGTSGCQSRSQLPASIANGPLVAQAEPPVSGWCRLWHGRHRGGRAGRRDLQDGMPPLNPEAEPPP